MTKHINKKKKGILGIAIYPVRVIGYALASISIISVQVLVAGKLSFLAWLFLIIFNIYPHIAFLLYRHYNNARQVEFITLLIDMFWIGWITNLVYFTPAVFLPYFVTNSATNYAVNGLKACLQGIASYAIGLLIAWSANQTTYYTLGVPDVYLIAGFAYLIAGSHYIGILSHWRGMVLRKAKTAIENQNTELNQQKNDIELQKSLLERHNQVIQSINQSLQDSIEYAQQIQTSLLPLATDLAQSFKQHFVLFMPRDMVSGDFYFLDKDAQSTLIAAIDCVGHGIPGAFLSLLTHQMLQNIVSKGIRSPEVVLEHLHQGIRQTLQQAVNQNRDGLDAAICLIEPDKKLLSFAGAKNPLYYFENNILHIVEANRKSIGGEQDSESHAFDKHLIQLADNKKQVFYLFTDGYADQFGGEENKKLGKRKFKQLLADLQHLPLNNQKDALVQYLREWTKKGKEDQIDDILLIGFEVL